MSSSGFDPGDCGMILRGQRTLGAQYENWHFVTRWDVDSGRGGSAEIAREGIYISRYLVTPAVEAHPARQSLSMS